MLQLKMITHPISQVRFVYILTYRKGRMWCNELITVNLGPKQICKTTPCRTDDSANLISVF